MKPGDIFSYVNIVLPYHLFSNHYIAYQEYPHQRTEESKDIAVSSVEGYGTTPEIYFSS